MSNRASPTSRACDWLAAPRLRADLVVDAGGRGSPVADLLADIGAPRPPSDEHDSGFAYTGRYYRSRDGELPELRAPIITPMGSISLLTLPAD